MLSLASSIRRRPRPNKGDAWRRIIHETLEAKQLQSESDTSSMSPQHSDITEPVENDTVLTENEEIASPMSSILTPFRHLEFGESEENEESDYKLSEDEEEQAEEDEGDGSSDSEEEGEPDDDSRYWGSSEDKLQWEKRYRKKDAAFRRRFGCGIDTTLLPETKWKFKKEAPPKKTSPYKVVLAVLLVAFLVQLAFVYSASSWVFSMVAWRPTAIDDAVDATGEVNAEPEVLARKQIQTLQEPVPEHVKTGLQLCSTLVRKVVKSQRDATATQHALRACDIAVKFAPQRSREAIEARVLRGDLRSLLSSFDGADEDYQAAWLLVEDITGSNVGVKLSPTLQQDLDLKAVANRWTQLYKTKSFKELREEAKARAVVADESTISEAAISELASDWLQAFKKSKPILDVLTNQRSWTLRRLTYEAVDDDDNL